MYHAYVQFMRSNTTVERLSWTYLSMGLCRVHPLICPSTSLSIIYRSRYIMSSSCTAYSICVRLTAFCFCDSTVFCVLYRCAPPSRSLHPHPLQTKKNLTTTNDVQQDSVFCQRHETFALGAPPSNSLSTCIYNNREASLTIVVADEKVEKPAEVGRDTSQEAESEARLRGKQNGYDASGSPWGDAESKKLRRILESCISAGKENVFTVGHVVHKGDRAQR